MMAPYSDLDSLFRPARGLRAALWALAALAAAQLIAVPAGAATSRIKDIVSFEGVRENVLIGYGLVAGLQGTGDSMGGSPFTERSLKGMLERLGVNVQNAEIGSQNVAAVMVTADLPAFARQGQEFDVQVSAMGDAESLKGGRLLPTPLQGANGQTYAVAQGTVQVNGFQAQGEAATVVRGVPTGGRIPDGAVTEREVNFKLNELDTLDLSLNNPDFTTAERIAETINEFLPKPIADATDPGTVTLDIPEKRSDDVAGLLADIEQLRVKPDQPAKVVVEEDSGTIVMGQNVRISTVAIAKGNLTIRVTEAPQVAQPGPFANQGQTEVVPRTQIQIDEENRKLTVVDGGVTLQDLVSGLNALGVSPRDLITILQSVKAAGALQADLEVM